MKIQSGCVVEIRYELYDDQDELLEKTEEAESYLHGAEEIVPGLERALEGKEAGETVRVTLEPADAFGEYDPEGLVGVPRDELPPDAELVKGDVIGVALQPEDGEEVDGETELEMMVVEVRDDEVVLDANHPLAGAVITFQVEVVSVRSNDD